jgi:hypothetical protein
VIATIVKALGPAAVRRSNGTAMNGIMELSEKLQKALIFRIEMTLHGAQKPSRFELRCGTLDRNRNGRPESKRPGISTSYEHVS